MGRRQAMATASSTPPLGERAELASRRTLLRRAGGRPRPFAVAGIAQRHQPASRELLSTTEARASRHDRTGERERRLLRVAAPFQRTPGGWQEQDGGSGVPLLLLESNRLQRPLPLQSKRRVQRPVRTI